MYTWKLWLTKTAKFYAHDNKCIQGKWNMQTDFTLLEIYINWRFFEIHKTLNYFGQISPPVFCFGSVDYLKGCRVIQFLRRKLILNLYNGQNYYCNWHNSRPLNNHNWINIKSNIKRGSSKCFMRKC